MTFTVSGLLHAGALTFDVDWAPDWAIALCDRVCEAQGVTRTFFVTHECDILTELRRRVDRVELGIHPNLLPGSSHGTSPAEVLGCCLDMVPEARALRTHALVQSSPWLDLVADASEIAVDVSLLLPFHRGLQGTDRYVGRNPRRLVRLPYFWEDDIAAAWPAWRWEAAPDLCPGLRIYDFHPIHVALNTDRMQRYTALKAWLGDRPLWSLTEVECQDFVNPGVGVRTFLEQVLRQPPESGFLTTSQLSFLYQEWS